MLERLTRDLAGLVETCVSPLSSHCTVLGRVKSFDSYFKKYLRYLESSPADCTVIRIPDKIGIRIICQFMEDRVSAEEAVKKVFEVVEVERKGANQSFNEFGYDSFHILIKLPEALRQKHKAFDDEVAEIQIRTILQQAWSEVEHELVYKAEFTPFGAQMRRKLAAVNGSLSLADIVFQEIRSYQKQLHGELSKRRESFFRMMEKSSDSLLFDDEAAADSGAVSFPAMLDSGEIDDMLLNALYAHNKGMFDDAVRFYSKIIALEPETKTAALIYKHRGMAYFAQSLYDEARADFSKAFEIDTASYKSLYYHGMVNSVTRHYQAAIDDYTQSLQLYPYQGFCLYRRAQAYYHLEDYAEALADCEAALAMDPKITAASRLKELCQNKLKM
jgi:putative GTP pyrophosphokinase